MESKKQNTPGNRTIKSKGKDRRDFLHGLITVLALAGSSGVMLSGFSVLRGSSIDHVGERGSSGILRPAGALEEKEFLARCIRCTRCADACDPQCILFFGPEAGALQGTPYILPEVRGCTMCLKCGEVCPTNALKKLDRMEDIRMGKAVVDDRLCLPLAGRGVCGACHTVCPLREQAVTLGIRNAPEFHPDKCTGCGLCVEICLVQDPVGVRIETTRTAP